MIFFVTACASVEINVPRSGSGFLRKEFLEYRSVAVLPFEGDDSGEVSRAFAVSFHERFPRISIVDRKRVQEVLGSTITPGRLDQATLETIGKALDVQAVIKGSVYYPSIVKWFLQIEILDTKTGEMMGRSLVENEYSGALGKEDAARFAVEKLAIR